MKYQVNFLLGKCDGKKERMLYRLNRRCEEFLEKYDNGPQVLRCLIDAYVRDSKLRAFVDGRIPHLGTEIYGRPCFIAVDQLVKRRLNGEKKNKVINVLVTMLAEGGFVNA